MLSRIKKYIDYKHISVSAFEKSLGMSNASFGKSLKSGGTIGADKLEIILNVYSDLNPEWLISGKGTMLRDDSKTKFYSEQKSNIVELHQAKSKYVGIPLIPTSALAGILTGEVSILDCECERYVIPLFKDAEFLIPVKGSSMIPKYNSGDIVACKKLSLSDIFFQWNKVYVIDTDQGVLVKRVHKSPDPDHIKIVSENPKYEPFELHLSRIHAIAIVIGVVRLE